MTLSLEQVRECFNNDKQITWHDQYEKEWKDGPGPLIIVGVSDILWECVKEPIDCELVKYNSLMCGVVQYLCNDPNCNRCNNTSLIVRGHHKIIMANGFDPYGKVKHTEYKKKTDIKVLEQPVFTSIV